ncbi:hypothetical protein EV121DRAFT_264230 [Schizophyllum commune]
MARGKLPTGPSKLSKVLEHLKAAPRLQLSGVSRISLVHAYRNDHWGARLFTERDLPRIRYANDALRIEVERHGKAKNEFWRPQMTVELENGTTQTLELSKKSASDILSELMSLAGGPAWTKWVEECQEAGREPIQPDTADEKAITWSSRSSSESTSVPPYDVFAKQHEADSARRAEEAKRQKEEATRNAALNAAPTPAASAPPPA